MEPVMSFGGESGTEFGPCKSADSVDCVGVDCGEYEAAWVWVRSGLWGGDDDDDNDDTPDVSGSCNF